MSDPMRFYESSEMSPEKLLLLAARAERPSMRARRRAAIAVGVGGLAWASFSSTAAASTQVLKAGLAGAGKWIALGVVGAGALAGAHQLSTRAIDTEHPTAAVAVAATGERALPHRSAARRTPTVELESLPVVDSEEEAAGPASGHPSSGRSVNRAVPGRTAESIADQIGRLDAVRSALASGQGADALVKLDEYRSAYPQGAFGQEATLLRIEALVKSGQTASAKKLAERFERSHPKSPHIKRIRALLGE